LETPARAVSLAKPIEECENVLVQISRDSAKEIAQIYRNKSLLIGAGEKRYIYKLVGIIEPHLITITQRTVKLTKIS
jgi:hypothetical protein